MAKNIKDSFNSLKSTIVGTKTSDIDSKLDKIVKDVSAYKRNSGRTGYIDLVKTVISKNTMGVNTAIKSTGFSTQTASPEYFGQGRRLARYKVYDSIFNMLGYCKRALNVLTENILAPDDITKSALEIKPKSLEEDKTSSESKVKTVKHVIEKIKLEKYLNKIIKTTLKHGDFFCEIADSKTALTSRSMLAEHKNSLSEMKSVDFLTFKINQENKKTKKTEEKEIKININYLHLLEDQKIEITKGPKKGSNINQLHLVLHEGKRVVKLQSESFPLCFGYLIFPKIEQLSPFLDHQDQAVNSVCVGILRSLEKQIPDFGDLENEKELKDIIAHMLKNSDLSKPLNVRFVPPDKMQHFLVETTKYYPYGESLFDSSQFTAKVLIALETALAVHRLSRSTEKRKIGIELGLPRDARTYIEKLKEEFRKRKVSLDSFGTVDTIPSMITTFEDIFIPQKDGKPFVDINSFTEGNVDIRGKVDELKLLRDQLVSDYGVPPAFIGIEENSVVKATLSEENVLFARTVVSHQKYFTDQICDLIQKIFNIISPEEALTLFDDVTVALPAPKSLQFERQAKHLGDIAAMIEALERLGIPKEFSKKKYLPDIDWDEVKKYEINKTIDKELGTKKDDDNLGGLGGGGMGGMTGGF